MNYIIVTTILLLDQVSKVIALKYLRPIGSIPVIPNLFYLTYVENRGAAFGVFQDRLLLFIIITFAVLAVALFYTWKYRISRPMQTGISLVIAGALGNLIDRIRLGFVVDYFDFRVWPVFNIADCAIVVGAILLAYRILKEDETQKEL